MKKKRKKFVGQAEEPEIESEDMELETDLDSVFCNVDQPRDAIQHSPPMEIDETKFLTKMNPLYSRAPFFTASLKI
jgi:hypothetical protein